MNAIQPNAKAIFLEAIEITSPVERTEYLDGACGGDTNLRRRVDALLAADAAAGKFLAASAEGATSLDPSALDLLGTQIGPYKLRELLAEGGMGCVYIAEQEEPVRRKVALKVIKPGMDTREVLSRFEAERQVLALMDHPNVAKVLDAGTTDTGRPYFVMELVKGVPITEFCDQRQLAPRQRLELFIPVCRAIQHAHQKGIIHRDIKPSNILVTLHDDQAVPVVIDFGIAKAINQQITEHTVYTAFNQLVGSPLYMSPEQAEFNALDIDTRSDIYSLGVLLYELLTGSTPFESETFRRESFDEMRRLIREVDPPRPSQRVSTLSAENASTVTMNRGVDSRQLDRTLRGDLDWIVMKALEKDRNRRYESASSLAADVQRHLDGEPVQARPPRYFTGVRKWCRRHQTLSAASLVALLLLLMGASGLAADRYRQVREGNRFVKLSLAAARAALEADQLSQAIIRMSEARTRIEADQLTNQNLLDDVARLSTEGERYAKFVTIHQNARYNRNEEESSVAPAIEALSLYGVTEDADWLQSLRSLDLPEAHVQRVSEAVYELLLVRADHLTRWSGDWAESTRQPRLEVQSREAMSLLEKAISFHQPSRGYYWLMANCAKFLGNEKKEKGLRSTALETPPHDAAELFYINRDRWWGAASAREGYPEYSLEECYKDLREMLRFDPTYYNAMFFISFRLGDEQHYAEALVGWYACVALRPNDGVAIINRGATHADLGHIDEAKADFKLALAKQPNKPSVLSYVAHILASHPLDAIRDGPWAVDLARKACELTRYEKPEYIDTLACAYAETGDFQAAISWGDIAVEREVSWRRGDYAEHLESFRQGKSWREE